MFQSIGRGWVFLKQSWHFGQKTPVVLFPALLGLSIAVMTTAVVMLPLAGLVTYIRKVVWGQVAIGVLIGLLIIILVAIANTTAVLSSGLAGMTLSGQRPSTTETWKRLSTLGGDIFLMGLGLPVYHLWITIQRLFSRSSTQSRWEDAVYLFVPVLANEETTLHQTPVRIRRMQTDNCVFPTGGVGIQKVAMILSLASGLIGLAAGLGAAWLVVVNVQDASRSRAYAFAIAAFVTAIFSLPVIFYLVYTKALFNTCLYRWGISIRDARKQGQAGTADVPDPLAVAMGLRPGR